jgi:hypothetical protein
MTYWAREAPGFVRRTRIYVEFRPKLVRELHMLPQYGALVHEIEQDPLIARHLDQLVGSTHAARRLERTELTDGWVTRNVSASGGLGFDEEAFAGDYEAAEEMLYADRVRHVLLAPIVGLRLPESPIVLRPGLELTQFTDDEIAACLSAGYLATFPGADFVVGTHVSGVRLTYETPKLIHSGRDNDPAPLRSGLDEIPSAELVLDVLRVLRLLKPGRLSAPGAVRYGAGWLEFGGVNYHPLVPAPDPMPFLGDMSGFTLAAPEADDLVRLWSAFASSGARDRPSIALSLRRFGDSSGRRNLEDRLVDLMIAAEAVLLGKEESTGDLRYRVATRSALLLAGAGQDFRTVYRDMRSAYGLRNEIVHGSTRRPKGVDLQRVTDAVERHLRSVLRRLTDRAAAEPKGDLVDWDELLAATVERRMLGSPTCLTSSRSGQTAGVPSAWTRRGQCTCICGTGIGTAVGLAVTTTAFSTTFRTDGGSSKSSSGTSPSSTPTWSPSTNTSHRHPSTIRERVRRAVSARGRTPWMKCDRSLPARGPSPGRR